MMGKMEIELPDMYMMNRFMGICGNPKVYFSVFQLG